MKQTLVIQRGANGKFQKSIVAPAPAPVPAPAPIQPVKRDLAPIVWTILVIVYSLAVGFYLAPLQTGAIVGGIVLTVVAIRYSVSKVRAYLAPKLVINYNI